MSGADLTAEHAVVRVRAWCEKTQADMSEWLKKHNPECECEVGETYLDAAKQVQALLPESSPHVPGPVLADADVLARILDPAAFNPDDEVAANQRTARQASARIMADRAIAAKFTRERGFWGCACDSCLRCTGQCMRCGEFDPISGEDLCARCFVETEREVAS